MVQTLTINAIAAKAGFLPGADGKLNLPARNSLECQATGDKLAAAAVELVGGEWGPDKPRVGEVVITGAGPVWAYMAIQHALHGRVQKLTYTSPNAEYIVFNHGFSQEDSDAYYGGDESKYR